jgi:hypothetical protein
MRSSSNEEPPIGLSSRSKSPPLSKWRRIAGVARAVSSRWPEKRSQSRPYGLNPHDPKPTGDLWVGGLKKGIPILRSLCNGLPRLFKAFLPLQKKRAY